MKKPIRIIFLEFAGPVVQWLRLRSLFARGYVNIDASVVVERGVNLDRVYPESIVIEESCLIASGAVILCHEHVYRDPIEPSLPLRKPVVIGARTFVGVSATICPGVKIGCDCIVGAGSVVTKDIPDGCIAGVPARVIKTGLRMTIKRASF